MQSDRNQAARAYFRGSEISKNLLMILIFPVFIDPAIL